MSKGGLETTQPRPTSGRPKHGCWKKFTARLEIFFQIKERGSTVGREILGGILMFVSSLYILTLQPLIQTSYGADIENGSYPANAIPHIRTASSFIAGAATGMVCNLPMLIAPAMGLNEFFVKSLVPIGGTWQNALGLSFIASIIHFAFISVFYATNATGILLFTTHHQLRVAVILGIGLLLAFVGLKQGSGIGLYTIGEQKLYLPTELTYNLPLGICGLILLSVLYKFERIRSIAPLLMVLFVTLASVIIKAIYGETLIRGSDFHDISLSSVSFQLSFGSNDKFGWSQVLLCTLTLWLHKLFDTLMTVLALIQTKLMIENQILAETWKEENFVKSTYFSQKIPRVFFIDALSNVVSSLLGISPTTLFVESFISYAFGAMTGLASVVCGLLFLVSIGLYPILALVPPEASGVLLVVVICFFFTQLKAIEFDDLSVALPMIVTMLAVPLVGSIGIGANIGFVIFTLISLFTGTLKNQLELAAGPEEDTSSSSTHSGNSGKTKRKLTCCPLCDPCSRPLRFIVAFVVCLGFFVFSILNLISVYTLHSY